MNFRYKFLTLFIIVGSCLARTAWATDVTADSLLTIAMQHYADDRLTDALDYATRTLKEAKKEGNTETYLKALNTIAATYGVFKDYEKAEHYFKLCYEEAMKAKNKDMAARAVSNLTMTSSMLGKVDEARHYLALQEKIPQKDAVRHHYFYLANQGKVAFAAKEYRQAIYFHQKAREFAASHNMGAGFEGAEVGEIASAYGSLGEYDHAIELLNEMLDLVKEANDMKGMSRAHDNLAKAYRQIGDSAMAAYHQEQSTMLDDSVFNSSEFNAAKSKLSDYEEELKEREISSLNSTITHQLLVIALFAVMLFAVVGMALAYRKKNKSLQEAYYLLVEKNKETIASQQKRTADEESEQLLGNAQRDELLEAINQVLQREEIICDPSFDLAHLSTLAGSNTKYVSWVINNHYNKSFKALLNERRIRIASIRLTDTEHYGNLTIQAIAESVGYNSQANFIQAFKRIVGMTPSMYQTLTQ